MTDSDLKKLKRSELLEMLIAQMEEKDRLKERLADQEKALQARQIAITEAGSIAEAALSLNGVFAAAQSAAQQYLENVQRLNENQAAICEQMKSEAQKKAAAIVADAEQYKASVYAEAKALMTQSRTEADAYWDTVNAKVQELLQQTKLLQGILQPHDRGGQA